jgi:sugar phosphate isomerase/epimerase
VKYGYHAVYSKNFYEGIDDAFKNGFDFVQFDLGIRKFFLDNLTKTELTDIADYAKQNRVEITFHSPGDNVSLTCDYPMIRQGILDEFKLILHKANQIGARHVTFHVGEYPQFKKSGCRVDDLYSSYYEDVLFENLKCLTDNCGDVFVCVENLGLNDSKRKAISRLFDEQLPLYLTLDTAKMYTRNAEINEIDYEFFKRHKDKIREMHIHDMNKEFGGHQIVGNGFIDFQRFKQFIGDEVYLNFEVRPVEAAKQSKDNCRAIWNI